MTTTPDSHVASLIGREAVLEAASKALSGERMVAIAGPGGAGKTAVALAYMRRFSSRYRNVLWMNARMRELLLADCVSWSAHLGLPLLWGEPSSLMIQPLRNWLATQRDYLLILDGADDLSLIRAIFPLWPAGYVLLTTSTDAVAEGIPHLRLDRLSDADGALLLLRRAGLAPATALLDQVEREQASAAIDLAQEMGGLPLALELAGAMIKETRLSVRDYHLAYQQYSPPRPGLPPDVNQSVAKACALACASLEEQAPAAVALLRSCAFLAPDAIQADLLTQTADDTPQERSPLEALAAFRLVNPQQSPHMLRMHHPVQAALRAGLAPEKQQQGKEQAMRALQRQLILYEPATIMTCLRFMAHIKHLDALSDQWTFRFPEAAEVFSWAAMILHEQKNDAEAIALQQKALAIWERSPDAAQPETASALHNLATLCEGAGDYAGAEQALHRAVQMRATALGAEHPDTILSLGNLGYVYAEQSKAEEAEATYLRALSLCERQIGMENSLTKQIQFNLARLYIEMNRYAEAEALLRGVCSYYERALGAKHLTTARALHMLANATLAQERLQDAETLLQRAIRIFESVPEPPQAEIVECLHQLMLIYAQQEKKGKVEATARRLLAVREAQAQGQDSPETVVNLAGLAGVYFGAGRFAEAEALLQRALAMCERMPEMGATNMAILLNTLAAAYVQHGQRDAAITILRRAFQTWEQALSQQPQELAPLREEYQRLIASL